MEKVYRLGDISENKTDFERTTFIVKNEKNGKRIFCYTEKNGRLSNLKKCDSLYDDSSLFEFFKSIKENFLINDELSIYDIAKISNIAGSLVCEESGVVPINKEKLLKELWNILRMGVTCPKNEWKKEV